MKENCFFDAMAERSIILGECNASEWAMGRVYR